MRKKSKPEYGRSVAALIVALALVAGGCGDDDEDGGGKTDATGTRTTEQGGGSPTDLDTKPPAPEPAGSPPKTLQVEDIVKGKGRAARRGDAISVQYVGVAFSNGQEFDSSWERGQPFQFRLGANPPEVISGWDRGLVGMRQGGRRQLTIPPDLAYGADGQPPDIGPNETLVFVVDLVRLR
jgi:peptidylprolyl isomerase